MSSADQIESLFALFSQFLSAEWTRKRQPYGFLEAVRDARSSPIDKTPKIFIDTGFQAWVAYFVQKPGKACASGQSALRQLFDALDDLPDHNRKDLAQRVNNVSPHPTVTSLIQSMMEQTATEQPVPPAKRRRKEFSQLYATALLTKAT
jgi:hypothetical protein